MVLGVTTYVVLNDVLGRDIEYTELIDLHANLLALVSEARTASKWGVKLSLVTQLAYEGSGWKVENLPEHRPLEEGQYSC